MQHYEVNFDGLVGPTHNYAGLSFGNVASVNNADSSSSPKSAALQGLRKMKALHDMGLTQGVLAPQERPDIATLRRLGFTGNDQQVLQQAARQAPAIFRACCSASSMWTANAATVSPGGDTADGRVHFTPANLTNKFHRSLEPLTTGRILQAMFANEKYFKHHLHLPDNEHFGDEGAANHTRFCTDYGHAGVELFVYGRHAFDNSQAAPTRYPARQTLEASQAIARLHGLAEDTAIFAQQNPAVIDQGVFHNDVIAVGNQNVLFYHEQAFLDTSGLKEELQQKLQTSMHFIEVPSNRVSVADAVATYLFNTQLITLRPNHMVLVAPTECEEHAGVAAYLADLVTADNPIKEVRYFDVKQSMRNGGGPACLRLRVALNDQELAAVNPACVLTETLYKRLVSWVEKHYRDELAVADLADPQLLQESRAALDELTQILQLGSVYPFQL